jgi:tRNA(Ile)-lysidine synthase
MMISHEVFINRLTQLGIAKNHKLLVAFSGGMDSVCLLHLLHHNGYQFSAAHVNYGLRGNESKRDELFATDFCNSINCPLFTYVVNDISSLKAAGINLQQRAREIRYHWFQELKTKYNFDFILTAHHANDNAETILLNIIRGTGINGLMGIAEGRDDIKRPLLTFYREHIRYYLQMHNISFVDDSSNASNDYNRNFLRNEVFPLLEKVNTQTIKHINDLSTLSNVYHYAYNQLINDFIKLHVKQPSIDELTINVDSLSIPSAYLQYILHSVLSPYEFNAEQCKNMVRILPIPAGNQFYTDTHLATTSYNQIHITPKVYDMVVQLPQSISQLPFYFNNGLFSILIEEVAYTDIGELNLPGTLYCSCDSLNQLSITVHEIGDKFKPFGMRSYKKISDYLIDKKVPLHHKKLICKLTSNNKILALLPFTIDNDAKVESSSKHVLKITIS